MKELARHFLLDRIERKFVLPASAVYTISEQVSSGLEEAAASPLEEPDGVLSVTLVEARQLVNRDDTLLGQGVSDPYATLQFSADNTVHRWEILCSKRDMKRKQGQKPIRRVRKPLSLLFD